MMLDELDYYSLAPFWKLFKLDPRFLKFRQIRLLLKNGNFIKIKDRVDSPEKLRKILLRYRPLKAYYMVSQFLNPSTVGRRTQENIADNCFLNQDLVVFDIDENPKENAKKLLKYLKAHKMKVLYIIFSGQKGIHIAVKRDFPKIHLQQAEREDFFLRMNEKLVHDVLKNGIQIDTCILNTRQIVKIPLSLSNGVPCSLIDESEIDSLKIPSPVRQSANDGNLFRKTQGLVDTRTTLQPYISFSNNILGTKGNYCLFLKFLKDNFKEEKIDKIIKKFNLSDCYLFESESYVSVISLKAIQYKRLMKILAYINPRMFFTLEKYKKNLINVSDLQKLIKVKRGKNNQNVSKSHLKLLRFLGFPVDSQDYPKQIGGSHIKMATYLR